MVSSSGSGRSLTVECPHFFLCRLVCTSVPAFSFYVHAGVESLGLEGGLPIKHGIVNEKIPKKNVSLQG